MVVAIGILAAYGAVLAILHTFAAQSQKPEKQALVQARAAHAGGD